MMGCCCDGEKQRDAYGKGDGDGKMPRPNSVDSTRETLNRRRHPNLMEIEMVLHRAPLQQILDRGRRGGFGLRGSRSDGEEDDHGRQPEKREKSNERAPFSTFLSKKKGEEEDGTSLDQSANDQLYISQTEDKTAVLKVEPDLGSYRIYNSI
ncbi:hypothetical protein MRB53_022731 [Persea americana]|uniref:Uncharacterized protein n=1 Tax=Persea americana TaxID=3435 RepID=A0ACC2L7Y7_PERAE|nr:hypothetical protein MRB53_022731 [Persea americana]